MCVCGRVSGSRASFVDRRRSSFAMQSGVLLIVNVAVCFLVLRHTHTRTHANHSVRMGVLRRSEMVVADGRFLSSLSAVSWCFALSCKNIVLNLSPQYPYYAMT